MEQLKVAARFIAFVSYLNRGSAEKPSPEQAGRYARVNWQEFLPLLHGDVRKLLRKQTPRRGARA